jgi:hypothetical protein
MPDRYRLVPPMRGAEVLPRRAPHVAYLRTRLPGPR